LNRIELRVGGVPEHFNLPWILAGEQDLFHGLDVDVSFTEYGGGTGHLTKALDAGKLDVAVILFEGAMRKILNGGDYKIVKLYTDTPLIWGIHVAVDSPIKTIEQAKGKRYAISRFGSGSHLIAIVDAAERGWPTDNIEFVRIGDIQGARRSLASSESDVFLWEKYMTQPLVDDGEFRRIDDRVVPWPAFVVAVRNEVLQEHAASVRAVLRIVADTCDQLESDPGACQVIAQRYDLLLEDAFKWLERTSWNNDFKYPAESFQKVYESLKMLNLLDDPTVDPESAWQSLPSVE